jgi:hypothetical protein
MPCGASSGALRAVTAHVSCRRCSRNAVYQRLYQRERGVVRWLWWRRARAARRWWRFIRHASSAVRCASWRRTARVISHAHRASLCHTACATTSRPMLRATSTVSAHDAERRSPPSAPVMPRGRRGAARGAPREQRAVERLSARRCWAAQR